MDLFGMENYRKNNCTLRGKQPFTEEFVMFAGHELKTPVTVMKASLICLKEKVSTANIWIMRWKKMKKCVNFSQCIEGISLEFEAMDFEKEVKIARNNWLYRISLFSRKSVLLKE